MSPWIYGLNLIFFMATIDQLITNVQQLNFITIIEESIDQTKEQYKELQRDQMLSGEGKNGKIGKYQSKSYASKKEQINPKPGFGNVDLKLTGSFQNEIFVDVRTNSVVVDSADAKSGKLIEKYGDNIFGLNVVNQSNYSINEMGPVAVKKIKEQII